MDLAPTQTATRLETALRLEELADRVSDAAKRHVDHPGITLGETWFEETGHWRYNGEAGPISRHALGQLCGRLTLPGGGTAPAGYLSRCPAPLAVAHLNHWLSLEAAADQDVLVRTNLDTDGSPRVRAVLSTRYAKADHQSVLDAIRQAMPHHGLTLRSYSLDDDQMTLRLTVGSDHPASLDDPLRIGLHVSNSEVGLGRIAITAFITRLVCSNGLVVNVADLSGLRRRHIGKAGESLDHIVGAGIGPILEQADEACQLLVGSRTLPIREPVTDYIERVTKRLELPVETTELARRHVQGETLYDVINAFTRAAQEFPVAQRISIETNVSRLLDSSRWN